MYTKCILFSLFTILSLAFTVLRSARNALAIADFGGSASLIPYYDIFGTLPATLALSWLLAYLMRKYSLPQVFYAALAGFIIFFFIFSWWIYPYWRIHTSEWLSSGSPILILYSYSCVALFFVAAELWKVALISILLWGFINDHVPMEKAKRFYAPLMLSSSLGGYFASSVISYSNAIIPEWIRTNTLDEWHATLVTQMGILSFFAILIGFLFYQLSLRMQKRKIQKRLQTNLYLSTCLRSTIQSPLLRSIGLIVIADYLSYTLFEVIFLEALKEKYSNPLEYFEFMGVLGQWSSILTAIGALAVGPWLAQTFSWTILALITPFSVILTAGPFLLGIIFYPPEAIVGLGCLCYCLCRATKYALFDSAKEIAYISVAEEIRIQGKLVIEGLASRSGRALASLSTLGLISASGGVFASAPATLAVFMSVTALWSHSVIIAGREVDREPLRPVDPLPDLT